MPRFLSVVAAIFLPVAVRQPVGHNMDDSADRRQPLSGRLPAAQGRRYMQHGGGATRRVHCRLLRHCLQRTALLRGARRAANNTGDERNHLCVEPYNIGCIEALHGCLLPRSLLRLQFRATVGDVAGVEHQADDRVSRAAAEAAPDDVGAQAREPRRKHHACDDCNRRRVHAVQCACASRADPVGLQPAAMHDIQVPTHGGLQCTRGAQLVDKLHRVLRVSTSVPDHPAG